MQLLLTDDAFSDMNKRNIMSANAYRAVNGLEYDELCEQYAMAFTATGARVNQTAKHEILSAKQSTSL